MGHDPNAGADLGTSVLHYACGAVGGVCAGPDCVALLLELGAAVDVRHPLTNATPLHAACAAWDPSLCEVLVRSGADVNAVDRHGNTPLLNIVVRATVLGWPAPAPVPARASMEGQPTGHAADAPPSTHQPHPPVPGCNILTDRYSAAPPTVNLLLEPASCSVQDAVAMACVRALLVDPGVSLEVAVRGKRAQDLAAAYDLPGVSQLLSSEVCHCAMHGTRCLYLGPGL
jgi:hypothetical protein